MQVIREKLYLCLVDMHNVNQKIMFQEIQAEPMNFSDHIKWTKFTESIQWNAANAVEY